MLLQCMWFSILFVTITGSSIIGPTFVPRAFVQVTGDVVVMGNSILTMTFSIKQGAMTSLSYGGVDNLLEDSGRSSYWYYKWVDTNETLAPLVTERMLGGTFQIVENTEEKVEISFTYDYKVLFTERGYILRRGNSGYYSYAIFMRGYESPLTLNQIGAVYAPNKDKFNYMAVSDTIQKYMPTLSDILNGEMLADNDTTYLTNPTDPNLKGQVDGDDQYAMDAKDIKVHGWISFNLSVGFWLITPTFEAVSGGPFIQKLTSSAGPTSFVDYLNNRFGGSTMIFEDQSRPWTKLFGPHYVHLNSVPEGENPHQLWGMAKEQYSKEVQQWPYDFIANSEFPLFAANRGLVTGRLLITDRYKYKSQTAIPATHGWIGLAPADEEGSWEMKSKGYQFWTEINRDGTFRITSVVEGEYNLHAWVPGFMGEYKSHGIVVYAGQWEVNAGDIVFSPPRSGPTVWEIGIPDRSAAEFFIPDPSPNYTNQIFTHVARNKFRQYGLWDRYTDLNPNHDIIFKIGASNYQRHWFFSHFPRRTSDGSYMMTTWKVRFSLALQPQPAPGTNFTLWVALASANQAQLQVLISGRENLTLTTEVMGEDRAIAGHQSHGVYHLVRLDIPSRVFNRNHNTISLSQTQAQSPFVGLMYDYLRLEGDPTSGI